MPCLKCHLPYSLHGPSFQCPTDTHCPHCKLPYLVHKYLDGLLICPTKKNLLREEIQFFFNVVLKEYPKDALVVLQEELNVREEVIKNVETVVAGIKSSARSKEYIQMFKEEINRRL